MHLTHRSLLLLGVLLALAIVAATAYAIDIEPPWTQSQPPLTLQATPADPAPSPAAATEATPVPTLGPWDRC